MAMRKDVQISGRDKVHNQIGINFDPCMSAKSTTKPPRFAVPECTFGFRAMQKVYVDVNGIACGNHRVDTCEKSKKQNEPKQIIKICMRTQMDPKNCKWSISLVEISQCQKQRND